MPLNEHFDHDNHNNDIGTDISRIIYIFDKPFSGNFKLSDCA